MISVDELVELTEEQEDKSPFRLGTVVELFGIGTAKVQFDGEEEPSEKEYAYLSQYVPETGDRVLLAQVAGTYIIMDKILYKETVEKDELFTLQGNTVTSKYNFSIPNTGNFKDINVSNNSTFKKVNVSDDAKLDGDLRVNGVTNLSGMTCGRFAHAPGAYFGVFGRNPTSQKTCNKIVESSNLVTTIRKLNELIDVLYDYGFLR